MRFIGMTIFGYLWKLSKTSKDQTAEWTEAHIESQFVLTPPLPPKSVMWQDDKSPNCVQHTRELMWLLFTGPQFGVNLNKPNKEIKAEFTLKLMRGVFSELSRVWYRWFDRTVLLPAVLAHIMRVVRHGEAFRCCFQAGKLHIQQGDNTWMHN